MTHLLTWHGTVVCRERVRGALVHRSVTGPFDGVDVLEIGDLGKVLQADVGHLMRDDEDALHVMLDGGPLAGWTISRAPDHRSLNLSRGGNSLTALAGGDRIALAGGDPGCEGRFLAIGPDDLAALRDVVAAKWLVESAGASKQPQIGVLTPGFGLRIGALDVDLCWNLPFDLSEWPHQLTLLPEAWRLDRIYRYRPLIYFAVFGDTTIMRQFALSLASLVTTGAYDGAIVVMTDKTTAEISALVPPGMRATLVVMPTAASDRLGYMASRLTIGRWPDAGAFQPLLYVDTDIIFDLPVSGVLQAIALSDRMTAVEEPTESLATSDVVGSGLIRADGCSPGSELGFNFGALGIPNLRRHGPMLALMGRVLHNRLTLCGRESLPFPDQAIANYVAYRRRAVDTALLSAYVRLASQQADPASRRGLVHFCWATGAVTKADAMQRYFQRLAESGDAAGTWVRSA
ncbi:hypothetical protein [Acidisphaera sp. S103]|uniref:hypothetical protein n=1 Tax=Acidisphaera sp. S103 TaxID=1747223 RepID=UPI00131E60DD|nr:hypothetical protein [Acidisphaera sp. S103]